MHHAMNKQAGMQNQYMLNSHMKEKVRYFAIGQMLKNSKKDHANTFLTSKQKSREKQPNYCRLVSI